MDDVMRAELEADFWAREDAIRERFAGEIEDCRKAALADLLEESEMMEDAAAQAVPVPAVVPVPAEDELPF